MDILTNGVMLLSNAIKNNNKATLGGSLYQCPPSTDSRTGSYL